MKWSNNAASYNCKTLTYMSNVYFDEYVGTFIRWRRMQCLCNIDIHMKNEKNIKQLVIFLISIWDYKVDLKQITKLIEYQIFNFLLHRFQWFNDCFGCKNIDIFWKPSRWRRSILAFICSVLCHWTVQCTDIDCTRVKHHCNVVWRV